MKTHSIALVAVLLGTTLVAEWARAQKPIQQKHYDITIIQNGDTLVSKDSLWSASDAPLQWDFFRMNTDDTLRIGVPECKKFLLDMPQLFQDSLLMPELRQLEQMLQQLNRELNIQWSDSAGQPRIRLFRAPLRMEFLGDSLPAGSPARPDMPVWAPFNEEEIQLDAPRRNAVRISKKMPHPVLSPVALTELAILREAGLSNKQLLLPPFDKPVKVQIYSESRSQTTLTLELQIDEPTSITLMRLNETGKVISQESLKKVQGILSRTFTVEPHQTCYWVLVTKKQFWARKWGIPSH